MLILENMKMALAALKANKMRSFLTMLGIIIGIGAVIAITSVGDTMRRMFSDIYKDVGVTQGYVYLGYWVEDMRDSDYFTMEDYETYKKVFGDKIAYADSSLYESGEIETALSKRKMEFQGIDYNYNEVQPISVLYGRFLNEEDVRARKAVCVIDKASAIELYGSVQNAVGKSYRSSFYGTAYDLTIVGVYELEVSAFTALMQGTSTSGTAFIPWTLLTYPNDLIYQYHFFADPSMNEQELSEFNQELIEYIARQKGRPIEEMQLVTAQSEMGTVDSMLSGISAAVAGIAAISLLVGGIGIMNIMLVSVTERTREIGTRKALGATTRDIMIQFLTESAVLSAVGGIIGILLAIGLVSLLGVLFSLPVVIKPFVILLAVGFSALVGIFFGIYPAKKAADRDPIIALRYE